MTTNFEKWKEKLTAAAFVSKDGKTMCFLDGACFNCPATDFCPNGSSDGTTCADVFRAWADSKAEDDE